MPIEVQVVRLLLQQHGRYPHDTWAPDVQPIAVLEVEGKVTPTEIIDFAKENFPAIPRHEFAIVGWPTPKAWDEE